MNTMNTMNTMIAVQQPRAGGRMQVRPRMRMRILYRYVLSEFVGPFFFGLLAFTTIFVAGDLLTLVRTAVTAGASLRAVAEVSALRLPQTLVYTLPMGILFGVLLAVGRLTSHFELVAIRSAGISQIQLLLPLIVIGSLASALAFWVNETVAPAANLRAARIFQEEVARRPLAPVRENVTLSRYEHGRLLWLLWAARYDPQAERLTDVTIVTMKDGSPAQTVHARELEWRETKWLLRDGTLYRYGPEGQVMTLSFQGGSQLVDLGVAPQEIAAEQKRPEEMSASELAARIRILSSQGVSIPRELRVRLHQKYALALASLVFALLAVGLGGRGAVRRGGATTGFGLSIVLIFLYYILTALGGPLAETGELPLVVGSWLADLVLGPVGLWLYVHLDRC
ncbi:MAG TPA: YjgP/YjgQ family permease [Firmicutes bacterium]|nr:YjgP/YjgQ family permease [Bacillota bacterium]